jgi:DNA-binding MarR family transcriptional regulator
MSASAFEELSREVRLLFHQLRATAERLHQDERLSVAHRGVLESLLRGGAQTVPALARARPVSRQHIQVLVNRLLDLGLVETRENPASRRSPLVDLTPAGRKKIGAMLQREQRALASGALPITERRLRTAAETLRGVRKFLASEHV